MPYKAGGKMITLDKMSKKDRAAYFKIRRNKWDCNPVTKIVPSKKLYNRKKKYEKE